MKHLRTRCLFLCLLLLFGTAVFSADFFDRPRLLLDERTRFPHVEQVGDRLIVVAQEVVRSASGGSGEIYLRRLTSETGREWTDHGRFGEPVRFSETEPNVFSATVSNGVVYVALAVGERTTHIYESSDAGRTFGRVSEISTVATSVAPSISARRDGGLVLFVNQDDAAQQNILSAVSDRGRVWSDFDRIESEEDLLLSFLPTHLSTDDGEYLMYQGLAEGAGSQFQLYIARSRDGGTTWEPSRRFTTFSNPGSQADPGLFDNQRPHLVESSEGPVVTWERRQGRESSRVFSARVTSNLQAAQIRQISSGLRSAGSPRFFEFEGEEYFLWFEEVTGTRRIVLAEPLRTTFRERVLSDMPGSSTFAQPVVHRGRVHIFWQNEQQGQRGLAYLEPDQRVDPPQLAGANFSDGLRAPRETAEIRITPPDDPSGIEGYAYAWTREPDVEIDQEVRIRGERVTLRLDTDEDGDWFFTAAARDRAGNWSEPRSIRFVRDLTPPDPVVFEPPNTDELGFLASNTFEVEWEEPDTPHIAGYSYGFYYLGPQQAVFDPQRDLPRPPNRIMTTEPRVFRNNTDNGLWALRVSPIDDIGNVGEPETLLLRLNKYVPVTIVNFVDSQVDLLGRTTIEVRGRGFAAEGRVERIVLDRDGEEPYDYTFEPDGPERFVVEDDRRIVGPVIDTVATGLYRLGIVHPTRGTHFTEPVLDLQATGTVKFGDFTVGYRPVFTVETTGLTLPAVGLISWLTAALLALAAVFSMSRLVAIAGESVSLRRDVQALIEGRRLDEYERRKRMARMKRRGVGLRVKFTAFFVTLVVTVVLMVSIPLGNFIVRIQQETLTDGLRERTAVLLESIVSGSSQFLPNAENNLFELNTLTLQTNAMEEATFATITGVVPPDLEEVVWASSDPRITRIAQFPEDERVIDTERLIRGESRYADEISEEVPELAERINAQAREALDDIPERIDRLNRERIDVAIAGGPDAEVRVGEIDDVIIELETRQQQILNEVADIIVSVPELDPETVLVADTTDYLFFKPIVYREIDEDIYFHGLVRVGVSSERIIGQIQAAQRNLVTTIGLTTLIAVAIGVVGALVLASIIVIPITRLVRGVELIRDTDDKAELSGHSITVKSRDELATLAGVVNEMTQGLVKAAVANKDLTVGKEVQKMFIPLKTDSSGQKLTTAADETDDIEFFGYYEGAKGVSGDYFNYRRLDHEHYAIIKCDVAGKGVPAALIMVEVATIYMSYFRTWNSASIGKLPDLVESINDLIEERGFQGRFAAFTLAILNARTGVARVCNAGDTLLYTFVSKDRTVEPTTLPTVPAAGVFPSELIPNGFPQVAHRLNVGDIVLFFTDGLEEAKRILRDENFQPATFDSVEVARFSLIDEAGNGDADESDEGQQIGDEELSIPRLRAIVKAVQSQSGYSLVRAFNPLPDEQLFFDFSGVEPTAENTVLAVIAVEKIFRLVPDPSAGLDDLVVVDREVDEFLQRTFLAYDTYFHHRIDSKTEGQYRSYSHLREDEQYDDLTFLAVRKK